MSNPPSWATVGVMAFGAPAGRRGRWRRRARTVWLAVRWPLLATLVVIAAVLGYVGFTEHLGDVGEPRSSTRTVYLTLQLFVLESGAVAPPTPWTLEVARLLAPAVTLYSAAAAIGAVFRDELSRARLRLYRRHVVVCGLGSKGALLVSAFREAGYRVAAVDRDRDAPGVAIARAAGAVVVFGDVRAPETIDRLRIGRASVIVAVCGDDATDAEVASAAQRLAPERSDPVRVFAHISDPALRVLLQKGEIMRPAGNALVEVFDVFDRGAGVMLTRLAPGPGPAAPQVAIVGLDRLGAALIVGAAGWWRDRAVHGERIQIFAVDAGASDVVQALEARHPGLRSAAEITPVDLGIDAPGLTRLEFLTGRHLDAAYVCVEEDVWALGVAAGLAEHAPTLARVSAPTSIAGDRRVRAFAVLEETCTPAVLLGGLHERLARAIHADYLRGQEELGRPMGSSPSMVPWDALADDLKASNRAQAADIGAKLRSIGCDIEEDGEWDDPLVVLEPDEVESLARREHERWMARLLDDGWRRGVRDPDARTHPDLVPYDALDEATREADRYAVRGIPSFLRTVGLRVCRRATEPSRPPIRRAERRPSV